MASQYQPTTTDKLLLIPVAAASIGSAILRLLTRSFTGGAKANTAFKDVIFAALRTNLSNISEGAEQWMNSTTEAEYLTLAKKQGFQPDTDVLGSSLKVHWIGGKAASKVLLYFHGGGYVLAASAGHMQWLYELQQELSKTQEISIVVLSYTLAPHGQYPTQLKEAAESLEWLLETQKKQPGDIFVSGDSAGGNMALMLLSHLLHPHPAVTSKINLTSPLAGAVLISPWTKFATDDDSVRRNQSSDMVTPAAANRWSSLFLGSSKIDNYNQTILVNPEWFKGLDSKVKDILVWGGGGEVLIDSIEASTKKLQQAHPRVEYVVQPGAAHEDFIIDKLLGYKEKGEGTVVVESWMKTRL
ncbi:uncharacterized protein LTR77_004789 [Saxophila tyrrhenica]|uniref:Alpha/beta hydrolase fold-3 domain-containing protein n=1 Tax=Saxophila tyrrhenica TaxID=1690608 RepID=A0AAV9PAW0_9PEZI|nr:hypothetical protein LTR77_004789 [Saxophila tyrrhenica]